MARGIRAGVLQAARSGQFSATESFLLLEVQYECTNTRAGATPATARRRAPAQSQVVFGNGTCL